MVFSNNSLITIISSHLEVIMSKFNRKFNNSIKNC